MATQEFTEELGTPEAPFADIVDSPDSPHQIECEVRRHLLSVPGMQFQSLVVRRVADGVCLEGVLETETEPEDIAQIVSAITGVDRVLNRLVKRPAPKG